MDNESPMHRGPDWLDLARAQPKRRARERPVVVVDIGHGWIPSDKSPHAPSYDAGAVYDASQEAKRSHFTGANELSAESKKLYPELSEPAILTEHDANEVLGKAIAQQLRARGFGVMFTTLDAAGNRLYSEQEVPKNRIQFRLDRAHTLRDSGQHVVGYLSVHHDSGFEQNQHGAAIALHIAAPETSLPFAKAIAGRVHGAYCPEGMVQLDPLVTNHEAYKTTYVGKFSSDDKARGTTHNYAADMAYPPVLRHGTNVVRANEHPHATPSLNAITRGLGDIPAVLIERAVLWNAHDRRKVLTPASQQHFAHMVAEGVADYWDAKCKADKTLHPRVYDVAAAR